MAITKKTEELVNELIQGMTRSAIATYKSGETIEAADIEALASLIAASGEVRDSPAPICGFIAPVPTEEADQ